MNQGLGGEEPQRSANFCCSQQRNLCNSQTVPNQISQTDLCGDAVEGKTATDAPDKRQPKNTRMQH